VTFYFGRIRMVASRSARIWFREATLAGWNGAGAGAGIREEVCVEGEIQLQLRPAITAGAL